MADAKRASDGGTEAAAVVNGEVWGVTVAKAKALVWCPELAGNKVGQRRQKAKSAVRARKEYGTHETYGRGRGKIVGDLNGERMRGDAVRKSNRRCEIRKDANVAETTEKEGVVCSKGAKDTVRETDGGGQQRRYVFGRCGEGQNNDGEEGRHITEGRGENGIRRINSEGVEPAAQADEAGEDHEGCGQCGGNMVKGGREGGKEPETSGSGAELTVRCEEARWRPQIHLKGSAESSNVADTASGAQGKREGEGRASNREQVNGGCSDKSATRERESESLIRS
ncbi:hypothetical protein R3P38DRAFT_2810883 [Favolaschia claudopus]|uniref:Uncharacterized protein n=1 Tax=Favolaschia claudopus TaxID=2862362 RepID=A0AAV9Z9X8_9AGAR